MKTNNFRLLLMSTVVFFSCSTNNVQDSNFMEKFDELEKKILVEKQKMDDATSEANSEYHKQLKQMKICRDKDKLQRLRNKRDKAMNCYKAEVKNALLYMEKCIESTITSSDFEQAHNLFNKYRAICQEHCSGIESCQYEGIVYDLYTKEIEMLILEIKDNDLLITKLTFLLAEIPSPVKFKKNYGSSTDESEFNTYNKICDFIINYAIAVKNKDLAEYGVSQMKLEGKANKEMINKINKVNW